jgi:hypothetical protein
MAHLCGNSRRKPHTGPKNVYNIDVLFSIPFQGQSDVPSVFIDFQTDKVSVVAFFGISLDHKRDFKALS